MQFAWTVKKKENMLKFSFIFFVISLILIYLKNISQSSNS